MNAVANKSGNSYYAQAAFISMGASSTGSNSDNYAVVTANVEKKTGTADGTVYLITAWNGKESITVKTDDSAAASMSKGDIFTYTATGDTLADIEYSAAKQSNYYVKSFDAASGDITLQTASESSGTYTMTDIAKANLDAWSVVDSKDTVVLFVNSDNGSGETGYTTSDIELAYVCDADYWSAGTLPTSFTKNAAGKLVNGTNVMSQDFAENVRVFVDNDNDDQITVLVVDVNRNITQW